MRDIIDNSNFFYKRMVLIELQYLFSTFKKGYLEEV
jgi:hypothetical protein